jgi:chorismate mutase
MAQNPAQIRAQIETVRARLEEELDELGPLIARRLQRARRVAKAGALAGTILTARRLLTGGRRKHRDRARKQASCCAKFHGKRRRR